MEDRLAIIGTDGTACMIGKYIGCIRHLEELVHRPHQWIVCLLHTNELPIRHFFAAPNGFTSGPNTFMGRIEKCLHEPVSNWSVGQFEQISMPISSFPKLPANVVYDLNTDQYYAYTICWAIINGVVESDLSAVFGGWAKCSFQMANFWIQNFLILHVFRRTFSDPKSFHPLLLNGVFSNLI